jgi:hypothetical protein
MKRFSNSENKLREKEGLQNNKYYKLGTKLLINYLK